MSTEIGKDELISLLKARNNALPVTMIGREGMQQDNGRTAPSNVVEKLRAVTDNVHVPAIFYRSDARSALRLTCGR